MFIKREDYQYLEGLCKTLSATQQERLMSALLGKDRGGTLGERVRIVGEEIYDSQGVEQKDWITRTMIKKAFKDAKLA